jgi:tryptophan-rich sensory protein
MSRWLSLLVFVALVAAAALSGGQFRPGAWYAALAKPSWTPPGWLFGPVWAVLYLMIAVAGWLVWRAEGLRAALMVWGVQLALNGAWSWLMFGRQAIGLALIDILAMLAAIIAFIVLAWPVSRPAAGLFVPYLAWVSFATALNATIWRMNG